MKERFISRYENAVNDYFDYTADSDGRMVRNYVVNEYEKILKEEFGMSETEVEEIYHRLYWEKYKEEK